MTSDDVQARTAPTAPERARRVLARTWPLAIFVVLAFAFTPRALLGERVLAPVDMLEQEAPWRASLDADPYVRSSEQTDQIEGLPNTVEFFRELRSANFQTWDPQIGAGGPTGTQPLWGLLSPFHAGYLFSPEWYAPALRVFSALLMGMGFTYLFLRQLGVSRTAAVVAGAAYGFNGANLVLLNRIMAVFLLPALLWACWRVLKRPSLGAVAAVAIFTAWAWVEGFPSGFFYNVFLAAAMVVWLLVYRLLERPHTPDGQRRRWPGADAWRQVLGRGAAVVAGMVWGVVLAAVNLIPFITEILRTGSLDSRSYDGRNHLGSLTMFGLLDPTAGVGPPLVGTTWAGTHPVEGTVVVGLLAVVAALAAVSVSALGRLRIPAASMGVWSFFAVMTPLVTLLVFFNTVVLELVYQVPGLAQGPFMRARYIIPFGIVVLGAIGFDGLVRRASATASPSRWWAVGSLAATVAMVAWATPSFVERASAADQFPAMARSMVFGAVLTAAVVGMVVLARRRPTLRLWVVAAGTIVVFVQLAIPLRGYTPEAPREAFFPDTAGHQALGELTDGRYRFAATMFDFYPNSSTLYDLFDLRGLVLRDAAFREHILAANPEAFERDPLKLLLARDEWNLTAAIYDEFAVRYLVLDLTDVPYGEIQPLETEWERLEAVDDLGSASLPAPDGEVSALALWVAAEGVCEAARVTAELSDGRGLSLTAERRADLAGEGSWQWFGFPGADFADVDGFELSMSDDDPACDVSLGVNGDPAAPAAQWMVDDPDDGVRLVDVTQALIYERPNAFEMVTVHDRWAEVPDLDTAVDVLAGRTSGADEPALVLGALPEFAAGGEGGPATVESYEIHDDRVEVVVDAQDVALLAVRQNYSPDWQASIDGEPAEVLALNGAQQAVFVPEGRHTVVLTYEPTAFRNGALMSSVGLVALLAAGTWLVVRRSRRGPADVLDPFGPEGEPDDRW